MKRLLSGVAFAAFFARALAMSTAAAAGALAAGCREILQSLRRRFGELVLLRRRAHGDGLLPPELERPDRIVLRERLLLGRRRRKRRDPGLHSPSPWAWVAIGRVGNVFVSLNSSERM